MPATPLLVGAALCLIVVGAELLTRHTPARQFGSALLVIVLGAVLANVGLLPLGDAGDPVYGGVFRFLAPLSIFWLLLSVNLKDVLAAGLPLIALFLAGALGTTLGVLLGMGLIGGPESLGSDYAAVGGMFVGTYVGGSVNFNAIALHYGVVEDGGLYAGSVAVDNIITAAWMVVCLGLPALVRPLWPAQFRSEPTATMTSGEAKQLDPATADDETIGPLDIGLVVGLGLLALVAAEALTDWLATRGWALPSILLLTTLALLLAQTPWAARLRGASALGMFAVYVFLTVIGAYCDLGALAELGQLGPRIFVVAGCAVLTNGLLTFTLARLLGVDPVAASIASQANVGGGTTALALARNLDRPDLVLPAILLGALGTALGTFLGFLAAAQLL